MLDGTIEDYRNRFKEALNDDLNFSSALAVVWEAAKNSLKSPKIAKVLKEFDEVLSLNVDKIEEINEEIPEGILRMLEERKEARLNKNFAKSDEIRDKLKEKGYLVIDSKEGQKLEKIK